MASSKVIEDMLDEKLLNLHTGYIAKVLSFNGTSATIQPLLMVKQYGKTAEKQSIVSNAPVVQSARYKLKTEMRTCRVGTTSTEQRAHLTLEPLSAGDLVFCMCAERDITEAKAGNLSTPQIGHHSISDTVVVGIL